MENFKVTIIKKYTNDILFEKQIDFGKKPDHIQLYNSVINVVSEYDKTVDDGVDGEDYEVFLNYLEETES